MTDLRDVLHRHVADGSIPGAVGLVAGGDRLEVEAVGSLDVDGTAPMARDSIFRIASITKPITAAAVMVLADDHLLNLDDPIGRWLPELSSPSVVRTPESPVDDVVPAERPITVFDLLTFRAGYGFPSDFSLPAVQSLFAIHNGPLPAEIDGPDEWIAALAGMPMLAQPGRTWLYNTCSDVLGVLVARVSGRPFPDFLAERIFEPLGMLDTAFDVPAAKRDRFASYYKHGDSAELELVDRPDGHWSAPAGFPSGAGGLVSTVDDWQAFARMLLAGGTAAGRRILSSESVAAMTTDYLTQDQREASTLFLEGQGWGFGGSVDVAMVDPWNVTGRFGWVGGTGTAAHITPATGGISILMTQVEMTGPTPPVVMRDFWRYAADA